MIGLFEAWVREMKRADEDPKRYEDEQGGWRRRVYLARFPRILSVLAPIPDPLCPPHLRHQVIETARALLWFMIWLHVLLANTADVPGIYPGWDLGYPFRSL